MAGMRGPARPVPVQVRITKTRTKGPSSPNFVSV